MKPNRIVAWSANAGVYAVALYTGEWSSFAIALALSAYLAMKFRRN